MQTTTPHITNNGWGEDGMQSYVNATMLFFGFSGLKLNVDRPSVCWLQHSGNSTKPPLPIAETPHVRISSQAWRVPTCHRWDVQPGADLEFKRIEPHTYVTYLGSTQTHTGEHSDMLEQLRKEVKLGAPLLRRKYITPCPKKGPKIAFELSTVFCSPCQGPFWGAGRDIRLGGALYIANCVILRLVFYTG
jgi:hypothetical protein